MPLTFPNSGTSPLYLLGGVLYTYAHIEDGYVAGLAEEVESERDLTEEACALGITKKRTNALDNTISEPQSLDCILPSLLSIQVKKSKHTHFTTVN
jgi:hypothetical protein